MKYLHESREQVRKRRRNKQRFVRSSLLERANVFIMFVVHIGDVNVPIVKGLASSTVSPATKKRGR